MKLLITCLFLGVSFVMMSSSFAQSYVEPTIESDARISKHITRKQVNDLVFIIRTKGYKCDSISLVRPFWFDEGYNVSCNRSKYSYEMEYNGHVWGTWTVTLETKS